MASETPTNAGAGTPARIEPLSGEPIDGPPLTGAGSAFAAEGAGGDKPALFASTRAALKDEAGKLTSQGVEKAKTYAVEGKDKAGGALEEFARLISDQAGTVDDKLGVQYGDYARSAANSLSGFGETLRDKSVDELLADAKELVKKSPAVAIGTAAAVGFVLARLVRSGFDSSDDKKA